jgi:hypothetical protein
MGNAEPWYFLFGVGRAHSGVATFDCCRCSSLPHT